jgi:diguanylate cyclase (GGDEF)-like protein
MNLAAVATAAGVAYALGWLTRQSAVAAARREASTDALTGLVNRDGLKRQLHIRAAARQPYTIYFIDLNGFKPVNDAYGHRAGDQLLARFGRRLATQFSQHLVARLGGDEFVIVTAKTPDRGLVAQLQTTIAVPTPIEGSLEPVILCAAVGVAYAPIGADPRTVLHTADMAMYRSKSSGSPHYAGELSRRPVQESPQSRIRDARSVRVAPCP